MSIPQYLLRVWGRDEDMIAALRAPDVIERDGDGPLCYWFTTAAERAAFERTWPNGACVVHDRINPGDDGEEVVDTRAETWARVVLRCPDGREVTIEESFGYGYPAHSAEFMWTEGNYSCDCNKRLYVWRRDGVAEDVIDTYENPCGDTIELVSLEITKRPLRIPGASLDAGRPHER